MATFKQPPITINTQPFNAYAIEFSPFYADRLAIASAANFGIVGNGRLLFCNPANQVRKAYDTQDGIFDVCWSECHENQLVTGGGDGSVKLWDISLDDFPIRSYQEHTKEVYSVNWNGIEKNVFVSGSWDLTIKLWNPEFASSLNTWKEHTQCIYQAVWSPHNPTILASASGDQTVKIWDTRQRASLQTIHAHTNEVLALDWNKYNQNHIVTGSVDTSIKYWDLRSPHIPILELRGHDYAVRRLKCCPHEGHLVASVSYDMTMRLWDLAVGQQVFVYDAHSEFAFGVDFNLFERGLMATCAWDSTAHILNLLY